MKKLSLFLAVLTIFMCVNPVLGSVYAAENDENNQVYQFEINDESATITYRMTDDETVIEEIQIYEQGVLVTGVERIVTADGNLSLYQDGKFVYTIAADFNEFRAMALGNVQVNSEVHINGGEEGIAPQEVYQVCGSTLPHLYPETTESTINVAQAKRENNSFQAFLSAVVADKFGGTVALVYGLAQALFNSANSTNCQYIYVKQTRYFVQDFAQSLSYNCYHNYVQCYNINSITGQKQIVDVYYKCYRVQI